MGPDSGQTIPRPGRFYASGSECCPEPSVAIRFFVNLWFRDLHPCHFMTRFDRSVGSMLGHRLALYRSHEPEERQAPHCDYFPWYTWRILEFGPQVGRNPLISAITARPAPDVNATIPPYNARSRAFRKDTERMPRRTIRTVVKPSVFPRH